jgi:nucleolar GTP-binding protein
MNKITRANVDVQPYAFTTKSLFVGHCDYRYLRWQVIDTPGILDHPLEERNTIEMQAITALAHLQCSVLYFVDISEQCGYTIEQQCSLFRSIQPLFSNKQLIIVVNKVDQQPWETLEEAKKAMVQALANSSNCSFMTMSNLSEHGVSAVKNAACDKLLASRVDSRVSGNKVDHVMNRLQVFTPKPRDNVERDVCIPESVIQQTEESSGHKKRSSNLGYAQTINDDTDVDMNAKKTARDLMWENGGPGVWAPDYRAQYDLKDPRWRFDAIPEIIDGKNIADYIDPDIEARLEALEKEEEQFMAELEAADMDQESDLDSEEEAAVTAIRERKRIIRKDSRMNNTQNHPTLPREIRNRSKDKHDPGTTNEAEIKKKMESFGVDTSKMLERGRAMERGRKRERSLSLKRTGTDEDDDDEDMQDTPVTSKGATKKAKKAKVADKKREGSLARSHSRPREPSQMGLKDGKALQKTSKLEREGRTAWSRTQASGEGDQRKTVHLIKWMNTGKKRMGTHYCR